MTNQVFLPSRRRVLAGLGGMFLACGKQSLSVAQGPSELAIRARPATVPLEAGRPNSAVWALETATPGVQRFGKGDLAVTLSNELTSPITLNWLGIDGAQTASPLTGQTPLAPGGRSTFIVPLRRAGSVLFNAGLLDDENVCPVSARALVIDEAPPAPVADRDEVLLIEEWRLKADGNAVAPGHSAEGTTTVYTVNGQSALDLTARPNERLRLRIVNGCARSPIGLTIENHDVRVIAIDSAPAEPFIARQGRLVLAPGARIDAIVDASRAPGTASEIILHDGKAPRTIGRLTLLETPMRPVPLPAPAPLPPDGLPTRLDLQGAVRTDLSLDPKELWVTPALFTTASPPVFRARRGRTASLAVTNPTAAPMVFRLQGHHFRLLDRLDDGWKPFWLDTLIVDARQTQRIAFAAEHSGLWLMEATPLNWDAPKRVRCYSVE